LNKNAAGELCYIPPSILLSLNDDIIKGKTKYLVQKFIKEKNKTMKYGQDPRVQWKNIRNNILRGNTNNGVSVGVDLSGYDCINF
jgi:hypothetical protein